MTPRKTASEIADSIVAQMDAAFGLTLSHSAKSFIQILAKVLGGFWALLYQYAGFALLQMFVRTASDSEMTINGIKINPLQEWGSAVGVYKNRGQLSEHTITITVLTQGGTLQSGTKLANPATEQLYQVIGEVALNAVTVTATIRSLVVGDLSNLEAGDVIGFVSARADVEKDVVVLARVTDGVDAETTEVFRQRVIDRYAARPQGGAYADYRDWAQSVVGVKRAYPYSGGTFAGSGAGQVDVYIESLSDPDGIPSQALLDDVLDAINNYGEGTIANRRPINDLVNVLPITRLSFNVEVAGLDVEDELNVRDAIEAALIDYFASRENYILGLSSLPRTDVVNSAEVNGVVGRVAAAYGGLLLGVTLLQGATPIASYVLQEGEKAKLGELYWT